MFALQFNVKILTPLAIMHVPAVTAGANERVFIQQPAIAVMIVLKRCQLDIERLRIGAVAYSDITIIYQSNRPIIG